MTPSDDHPHDEIRQWLSERGHTPEEIEKIMRQLAQFDAKTVRSALFESIQSGEFNIEDVIKKALGDAGPAS